MTYIDEVIRRICNREGEYANDPADRGGPTKYGITLKTLEAWRKKSLTAEDVKKLTLEEACNIYKAVFVVAPGYLRLGDEPLAEQLIDAGVNHSPDKAVRMLQEVVGAVQDGDIGQETKTKYKTLQPSWKVFTKFMARRLKLYGQIILKDHTQAKWAGGWMNRCAEMTEIYVTAVSVDATVESKILQVAKFARQESLRIQGSPTVRKDSPNVFAGVSKRMSLV